MAAFGVSKNMGRGGALWTTAGAANALALFLLVASSVTLFVGGRKDLVGSVSLLRLGLILAGLVAAALAVRGLLQAIYPERFAGAGATPWRQRRTLGTVLAVQGILWSLWCASIAIRPLAPDWGTYLPGVAVALTSALWLRELHPLSHSRDSQA